MRRLTVVISLLVVAALGIGLGLAISRHAKPVVTPQPSATPTLSAAPGSTIAASPTPAPTLTRCTTADLKLSLKADNAGAGHAYYDLLFTNTSAHSCTLYGFPGVSLIDAAGHQLGSPAERTSATPATVNISVGATAHAMIDFPNAANFDPGACSAAAANLRVFPPGETIPILVPSNQQACPGWSVQPIKAGQSG